MAVSKKADDKTTTPSSEAASDSASDSAKTTSSTNGTVADESKVAAPAPQPTASQPSAAAADDILPPDLDDSVPTMNVTAQTAASVTQPTVEQVPYEDYELMPDSVWPPPIFVRRDVTPKERYYIEHRWNSQWSYFDQQAVNNKKRYYFWQIIVVLGSVTVPVLVGFDPSILVEFTPLLEDTARIVIDTLTVIISLAVAIAAGIEGLNSYGEQWSSNRQAAEDMQAEKAFYDMRVRYYDSKNSSEAFAKFVQRTEEIIAQQNGRFIQSVEQQLESSDTLNQDVTSKYQKKFLGEENYTARNPSESTAQAPTAPTAPTSAG